ncbi:MAG TPA: 4-alpha-glucanotransferase [Polyangia bacterium]|jgi:4-alpha-glucanotransferase|nr:4-alpha-glucanotransferase [Polyangia bacterium]
MSTRAVTDAWGIDDQYFDVQGASHALSHDARGALLRAMGLDPSDPKPPDVGPFGDVIVVMAEAPWTSPSAGELRLEDGSKTNVTAGQTVTLPLGYHELRAAGTDKPVRVIASPGRCPLPPKRRAWGWAAQLYATRSRTSWGIGDLRDLRLLKDWARKQGADALLVNPLVAATPVPPIEASPYYPSSRRFMNPLYVCVDEAPGASEAGPEVERLAAEGRALNADRRIDRDVVFSLKMRALELCFAKSARDSGFAAYRAQQGPPLQQFAIYCALAERHGRDWRTWPEDARRPDAAGVEAFAHEQAPRVAFHAWLQWVLDAQLADAARDLAVVEDLPIGLDVEGADAWCWQALLADDVSVGAPSDALNPAGQDWGLTPFVPFRLRAAGYQPFIETLRATMRHAGGLRIDHVMGLFRLFWIPRGGGPESGGFVRPRTDELLAIVALESARAGAFVVGEDLGTVEDGVRETLAKRQMLSYRLAIFEPNPPVEYPELALASVTTHDLPTIVGLWTGADLARARDAGVPQNESGVAELRRRLATLAGGQDDQPAAMAAEKVHASLATSPCRVLLATLEDALGVEERPNLPGAPATFPNWSLALPVVLDDFDAQELPNRIAKALARAS